MSCHYCSYFGCNSHAKRRNQEPSVLLSTSQQMGIEDSTLFWLGSTVKKNQKKSVRNFEKVVIQVVKGMSSYHEYLKEIIEEFA